MSLHLQMDQGLATIVFNSPASMNIMGANEVREFCRMTRQIAEAGAVRVVLIRAEGEVYGAGADVGSFRPGDPAAPQAMREIGGELKQAILRLHGLPAIVLAAVHGAVIGSSLGAMNAADLVVAAKGTRFNTGFARIGASPDAGSTWFMPRLVGARKALEWLLFADNFDADTALAYGLVNQVVPPEQLRDVVDKLAARLLRGPWQSYAHMKRLVYQSGAASLEQQLDAEIDALATASATPDFAEGVAAFLGKRAPHFGKCDS